MLFGVMRLPGCPFVSAWCLVCEVCRLTVDWVGCRRFLSFVFLGGARRFELSPCNRKRLWDCNLKSQCQSCQWKCNPRLLLPTGIPVMLVTDVRSLSLRGCQPVDPRYADPSLQTLQSNSTAVLAFMGCSSFAACRPATRSVIRTNSYWGNCLTQMKSTGSTTPAGRVQHKRFLD